jgi:hypothetical protein
VALEHETHTSTPRPICRYALAEARLIGHHVLT